MGRTHRLWTAVVRLSAGLVDRSSLNRERVYDCCERWLGASLRATATVATNLPRRCSICKAQQLMGSCGRKRRKFHAAWTSARRTGGRPSLGDACTLLALRARILAWCQPQETLDCMSVGKPGALVECCNETQAGYGSNSRHGHQTLASGILLGQVVELPVGQSNLLVQRFGHYEQAADVVRKPARRAERCISCTFGESGHIARTNPEQLCASPSPHAVDECGTGTNQTGVRMPTQYLAMLRLGLQY